MKTINLKHAKTGETLYSGRFATLRHALEGAVRDRVSLAGVSLVRTRLAGASIDGADLRGAILDGACLDGANLSEADLTRASLRGADCAMTCFAQARLHGVDFTSARFAGTVLSGADVAACVFTCPSALSLPFCEARLGRNVFILDGMSLPLSTPPVVVHGLGQRMAVLDGMVLLGARAFPRGLSRTLTPDDICLSSPQPDGLPPPGPVAKLVDAHDLKS